MDAMLGNLSDERRIVQLRLPTRRVGQTLHRRAQSFCRTGPAPDQALPYIYGAQLRDLIQCSKNYEE